MKSVLARFAACQRMGAQYDAAFKTATSRLGPREEPLFRAMQTSLVATARSHLHVEEYHGTGHQVSFTGNGTYSRKDAQCELSDLLVLVYDPVSTEVRLSYIQAKSERKVIGGAGGVASQALTANLEQWDLLARRPVLAGVKKFQPPPDLLSSAVLDSVGAFAFFVKDPTGQFETYYAAATTLHPFTTYATPRGRLIANGSSICLGPWAECLSIYGNRSFAAALFAMLIGTPVGAGVAEAASTRPWLSANLRQAAADADVGRRELALELADMLGDATPGDVTGTSGFGAREVLIIRSAGEPREAPTRKAAGS